MAQSQHLAKGQGNPVIPGYFADPTVKKFGDTYYIYATTDGNGGGFGPSQVWKSRDFVNWEMQDMNWPVTRYYWAPDVIQGSDGRYYLYYCQPVEIFGAVSDTPVGPWTSLLPEGKPIVPNFLVPKVITLDGQTFRDDDGRFYMYWGTWGIYPDHGCGVGLLNPDMKSFEKLEKIPNTVAKDFFEAPFMFKRKGVYYLTYSSGYCEDGSYRVQYVKSDKGPMGPFVFGENNPVLSTNKDGTVHGPGHESILQQGDDFYMVYHRHNNPHSGGGFHRQIAVDKMEFDADGNILKLNPSHSGVGYLGKNVNPYADLALNAKIKASSFYSDDFKPSFANDNNNGTLWKPKNNRAASWLEIDLGSVKPVKSVHTQFEYATWYYQYMIEYSIDGKLWKTYADRTKNLQHGSPMADYGTVTARYIRLRITGTEYPGLNRAVWNIRVYAHDGYRPGTVPSVKKSGVDKQISAQGLLVDLDASGFKPGETVNQWENKGKLKGSFKAMEGRSSTAAVIAGKNALVFKNGTSFRSTFPAPLSLKGNSSFSVALWAYNPDVAKEEPIVSWTGRAGGELAGAALGYGSHKKWGAATHGGWADMAYGKIPEAGKWHHIALVFDGTMEQIYVDGVLDKQERKMLFIDGLSDFLIGTNNDKGAYFSGALASLKIYDTPLTAREVKQMALEKVNSQAAVFLDGAALDYGGLKSWKNEGFALGSLQSIKGFSIVGDVAGRIALNLGHRTEMKLSSGSEAAPAASGAYTLITQLYVSPGQKIRIDYGGRGLEIKGKSKWQHIACTFDGKVSRVFVDGRPSEIRSVAGSKELTFLALGDSSAEAKSAVSAVYIYKHAFAPSKILSDYNAWKITLQGKPARAAFKLRPDAVSPEMASMTAAAIRLPGNSYEYRFIRSDNAEKAAWAPLNEYTDFGLEENKAYRYSVKVRDNFGNVSLPSLEEEVKTDLSLFSISTDSASKEHDYLKSSTEGAFWDGMTGNADQVSFKNGLLTLSSANTKWDGTSPNGPFIYKNMYGDFIVETAIADLSGLSDKKAVGANDAGLMLRAGDESFALLQNSVMLGWGVGNMVTDLSRSARKQTNNSSAWNFYRHLQVQRKNNIFYLRGSSDGKNWKDLPGSPLVRDDMGGKTIQVGLFQASYGENKGYGTFGGFRIIKKR
ncbi:family 43 glycosylhydrolase [Pedobacter psychrodurus]|nr:family 43 glycosylhydrolase [Pedobacter psychrodurus]